MLGTDAVTRAIIRLFDQEQFYAELILQMDRQYSTTIPTAGVCVKEVIQLHINKEFFEGLSKDQQVAVLKHECQHIMNDHIFRAKELAPDVYSKPADQIEGAINQAKHKLINIAADCAINPGIRHLPDGAVYPKMFKLQDGETLEHYVERLKDSEELQELTKFDGHSLWSESEGSREEIKEKIRQAVSEAGDKAKAAGKMTSDIELLINRLNKSSRDWKRDLSRFAARTLQTAIESSKKKRNRRYGIMYPGSVKTETLHIGVAIDTSGSVSDKSLNQFMAEIANIAKYAVVTVVEADSSVKNSYVYDPKKTYKVSGRGGTAYQPAFNFFTEETEVDGVIYFGDMDCFDEILIKPKYPVLWAIVGNQKPPADWGSQLRVGDN